MNSPEPPADVNRPELAAFLRSRRQRVAPADVGLPVGPRRRAPGLRREEVAELAGITPDYYARLEQARGSRPTRQVLAGLVTALRLSTADRDQLYRLAGEQPASLAGPASDVQQSVLDLIDRLPDAAVIVVDAKYEVIAWNPLAAALLEDFALLTPPERNLIRRLFLHEDRSRRHYGMSGEEEFARLAVGHLRTAAERYPADPDVTGLVEELTTRSAEFAELWNSRPAPETHHMRKTIQHPMVGPIELTCDTLAVHDRDQQVIIFTAEPGTPAEQTLQLLAVIGTQSMDSTT